MKKNEINKIGRFFGISIIIGSWYMVMFRLAFNLILYLIVDQSNFFAGVYTFCVIVMFWSSYFWVIDRILKNEGMPKRKDMVVK